MKENIFLLGFMGCGKSYWSKQISQSKGILSFDLDNEIVRRVGKSIAQIFEEQGEAKFRFLEQKELHKTAEYAPKRIIALGGGTPCFFDNMDWINQNGISIFLDIPLRLLVDRLIGDTSNQRPLLKNKTKEELLFFVQKKRKERLPYYRQAKYIVHDGAKIEQLLLK